MAARIHLGLVFHQHQPVGNYGFVFEDLFQKSYEPLARCLERHQGVKAGLHYSGPLLDWLIENKPGYIERLKAIAARGQVEILGGGYYEPVLPAISEADRVGQLRLMRERLTALFGVAPSGSWTAERVWEPELPRSIAAAGYSWTIVDDVHFQGAGLRPDELRGWFLTESDGQPLGVFGSDTQFRYLVPWGTVDDCIRYLWERGEQAPGSLVTMGDDGEKFGGWPTTYLHCWEKGWVEDFFARLERESDWLSTVLLGDWRARQPAQALVYLPSTSYMEMGEWSLPPGEQHALEEAKRALLESGRGHLVRFVRGGHWRNFLVRYPEVNLLQKRILLLSAEAHRQENAEALDHLWQAECNCPFWHGVFGGTYLEHIRHSNFGHLAQADALLYPGAQEPETRDWNFDGRDEICLRSAQHLAIVAPERGGEIQHWELRTLGWHLTHAMARRPEAYHEGLGQAHEGDVRSIHDSVRVKDEAALAHLSVYDRGMRLAAQETLVPGQADADEYRRQRLAEQPCAGVESLSGQGIKLRVAGALPYTKELQLGETLEVAYEAHHDATLFSEWNLSLPEGEQGAPPEFEMGDGCCAIRTSRFGLRLEHNGDEAWVNRLYSVSNTEDGVELAPQGWSLIVRAQLSPEQSRRITLSWAVT